MADGMSPTNAKNGVKSTESRRIRTSIGPVRTVLVMVPFLLLGIFGGILFGYRHIKSEKILDLIDRSFGQLALDTYAGCVDARNSLQVILDIDRHNKRGNALLSLVLARLAQEYDGEPSLREESAKLFQEVGREAVQHPEIVPVLLWAQFHLTYPNIDESLSSNLDAALKLLPNHPLLLALAGELQLSQRHTDQARTLWEESLEKDPSNVHVVYRLGYLEEALSRVPRATERYQQALRLNNLHVGSLLALARIRIKQKKELDLVKSDLEKVINFHLIIDRHKAQAHRLLAELHFLRMLRTDGRAEIQLAADLRPQDSEFHYELAELCLKFFELDLATTLTKKVLQLAPDNALAKLLLIRCYLPRGQPENALKALDELVGQRVLAVPFFLLRGETYLALGQYQQAAADFQAIGENESEKQTARAFASLARLGAGDLASARKEAEVLTTQKPTLSIGHYALGKALLAAKIEWKAVNEFKRAVELDPRCYQCMAQLAGIALGRNKLADAEELLRASLVDNPFDRESNFLLGTTKLRMGESEAALEAFSRLVQLEPTHTGGLIGMAESLLLLNRPDQAIVSAEQARATGHVVDAHSWHVIGRANLASGKFQQALRDLNAADKLDEKNPELLADLGLAQLKLGMLAAAEKNLQESLKRKRLRRATEGLGRLMMLKGKFNEAANAFEQAASLAVTQKAPADEVYQLYMEGGRSWLKENRTRDRFHQARRLFGLARKQQAQEIDPLFQIAVAWEEEKRVDQARKSYNQVLDLKPDHPEALFRLGMLELEARNNDRAKELLQLFLTHAPSPKDARIRQVQTVLDRLK
jgi:tetratricopeptide (TPR) repeat protein